MALNLSTFKSLPLQLGSFLNHLKSKFSKSKSAGGSTTNIGGLSADNRHLFLQIVAFMLFAMLSFWVINQVRVNGPIFNTLKEYQDLTADTTPPPMYPLDAFAAYNEAYVASTNFNNEKRDGALRNAAKSEAMFKERSAYWRKNLDNQKLQASLDAVIVAGESFFQVANKRYIPSLPLGTVAASAPLSDLTAAFVATKQAGDAFTMEIKKQNDALVQSQTSFIKLVLFGLLFLGIVLLLLMHFYGKKQITQSAALTDQLRQDGQDNQEAVLQLLDEMGDLADGDLTVKAQVRDNIAGAIADSINYTIDSLRDLVVEINRATEQVTSATSVAQETSVQLLSAAETQSAQILHTTDAVTDMTRSILQVSSNAVEASQVAQRSLEAANQGSQAVQNTISGMNEIRTQIQETSKRIKRLGESSQEISEIVELISDITEQTNILALNAAIQAASAGEAGRGFTVVAEEVQRLAERSSEATKQISAIVKAIQTDTHGAVVAMEKSTEGVVEGARVADAAGQALSEIEAVTTNLAELIQSISEATNAQTKSADTVANNMQKIQDITTQTTRGTQQTADSVGQLTSLAEELRDSVAGFKL
ncbi:methyl-accepting chemotaxis protein PctB [mine drainage metagenome]|uniref:Methyl-accepting chemotaxis protein PctB n=1 Tax=mine drainage metagenome TaxID=410659 RepID=A0A1J5T9R7_9ZZZZ